MWLLCSLVPAAVDTPKHASTQKLLKSAAAGSSFPLTGELWYDRWGVLSIECLILALIHNNSKRPLTPKRMALINLYSMLTLCSAVSSHHFTYLQHTYLQHVQSVCHVGFASASTVRCIQQVRLPARTISLQWGP